MLECPLCESGTNCIVHDPKENSMKVKVYAPKKQVVEVECHAVTVEDGILICWDAKDNISEAFKVWNTMEVISV